MGTRGMGEYPLSNLYPSDETITLNDWLTDSSLQPGSLTNRKSVVRLIEKYNERELSQIIADIKEGRESAYLVSKRFVDGIRKTHSPYSVSTLRSMLPGLWESTIGPRFARKVFDRICPNGASYIVHTKAIPERQHVIEMLKVTTPFYRALIAVLACTGMRIREALSRKWIDVEVRSEGHARIMLRAEETKAKYLRYTFLTRECVDFLKAFEQSEYLFPGFDSLHISYDSAHSAIKNAYRQVGLVDNSAKGEFFTPHSFRNFAGEQMRDCGLLERDVLAIIGHKNRLGAEIAYLDWKKIEKRWVEHCAAKMCFLDTGAIVQKQVVELTRQNGKLELLLERLLERLEPNNP